MAALKPGGILWRNLATVRVFTKLLDAPANVVHNPEDFSMASGEVLVLAMILSWTLTYMLNPSVIHHNALKARVGFNDPCVGWDQPPAKQVAAPLFILCIYFDSRYLYFASARENLEPEFKQKHVAGIINGLCMLSWFVSLLIFIIDPEVNATLHICSFAQLIFFRWMSYTIQWLSSPERYRPKYGGFYVVFYSLCTFSFTICALIQTFTYCPKTNTRGPVPVALLASLDGCVFVCMFVGGNFRPRGPSVKSKFRLTSDEDFRMPTAISRSRFSTYKD